MAKRSKEADQVMRQALDLSAPEPREPLSPEEMQARVVDEKKERFLLIYEETGIQGEACKMVGVHRSTVRDWMQADPEFKRQYYAAQEQAIDRMEREAFRRAVQGIKSPVWYKGARVGSERKYSDLLLIFLLKGARPEKYRDRFEFASAQDEIRKLANALGMTQDEVAQMLAGDRGQLQPGDVVGAGGPESEQDPRKVQ